MAQTRAMTHVYKIADNILGFKFPQNRLKWPYVGTLANGFKMNDVIEDWRHRRRSLAVIGRAAHTIYSLLGIIAVLSNDIAQRNEIISWCTDILYKNLV